MNLPTGPVVPDPASRESKDRQVREMFSQIVPTYDRLNRFLSLGIDQHWRAYAVKRIARASPTRVLDLCGGTGDFGGQVVRFRPEDTVQVADFCFPMLEVARDRSDLRDDRHGVVCGDALTLPFEENSFGACLCGFGVRNWADLARGLGEVHRVLEPGGEFAVLDFFQVGKGISDRLGRLYVHTVLPTVGGIVSGNREAYQYLANSMDGFSSPSGFARAAQNCGFQVITQKRFFLGLCWFSLLRK